MLFTINSHYVLQNYIPLLRTGDCSYRSVRPTGYNSPTSPTDSIHDPSDYRQVNSCKQQENNFNRLPSFIQPHIKNSLVAAHYPRWLADIPKWLSLRSMMDYPIAHRGSVRCQSFLQRILLQLPTSSIWHRQMEWHLNPHTYKRSGRPMNSS